MDEKTLEAAAPRGFEGDEFEREEELNDAILAKMWQRDASSFPDLNFDRFCCSIFFFVEMWVNEATQEAYDHIFQHLFLILSGEDPNDDTGEDSDSLSTAFKPTLESFNNALDNEKIMEELNVNIGKSIFFNAEQYFHHFGSPNMTQIQLVSASLLRHQASNRNSGASACTRHARADHGPVYQYSHQYDALRLRLNRAAPRIRPVSSPPTSRTHAVSTFYRDEPSQSETLDCVRAQNEFLLVGKKPH
ncbi:hypothetical protein FI667_g16050, partial [Globisporangium splendens]